MYLHARQYKNMVSSFNVCSIFSGYLRDVSGDYFLTYHFVGTLTMCASLVLFVSHYKVKDVSEAVIEIDVEEEKERS